MKRNWRTILHPAPYVEQIKDSSEVTRLYKYWRIRTFYSIYLGYVLYYFTRKGFTFSLPFLSKELDLKMADLGIIGSTMYITYGISKFVSGLQADRSNPRYFMTIGLAATALSTIFFGCSSSLFFFTLAAAINGWFQGWGWPACAKQLTFWFAKKERGKWWSLVTTSHNLGGACVSVIVVFLASQYNWRIALCTLGVTALFFAFLLTERLRDVPESLGLPPVEAEVPNQKEATTKKMLLSEVLKNQRVWLLALTYFLVYILRMAFSDWGTIYLTKEKNYSIMQAATQVTYFEVGGFLGVIFAGWISDRIFAGRRVPFMIYSAIGVIISLGLFWLHTASSYWLDAFLLSALGFFIFGPQMLVGLAASEFVDKRAACSANGFAGMFAYAGAALTGYPLGVIIDSFGWNGFFILLALSSLGMLSILLLLSLVNRTQKEATEKSLFSKTEERP